MMAFHRRKGHGVEESLGKATVAKVGPMARPDTLTVPWDPPGAPWVPPALSFYGCLRPDGKTTPYFPRFYRGSGGGGNLLLLWEGADPAASLIRGRHRRGNRLLYHLHTSLV